MKHSFARALAVLLFIDGSASRLAARMGRAALVLVSTFGGPLLSQAAISDPAELRTVFNDVWQREDAADLYPKGAFRRLDETPDSLFYSITRFVEHIDPPAVSRLTKYHESLIAAKRAEFKRPLDVLDLCSSWTSHVGHTDPLQLRRFVALGMNAEELAANPAATEPGVVQDLNANPALSFKDGEFDLVLLQLSIDYLTRPAEVMREAARVLRPGGSVHVSFSNRIFIDKATAQWTGKPDIEHIETVGDFIKLAGGYDLPPLAEDLSPQGKGDPLYVVSASKRK